MATQNYFAMDPAISRTVSNLTRALIGSPSDDAASARARYYDEQTKAQQLQSRGLQEQLDAQNAKLLPTFCETKSQMSLGASWTTAT